MTKPISQDKLIKEIVSRGKALCHRSDIALIDGRKEHADRLKNNWIVLRTLRTDIKNGALDIYIDEETSAKSA